MTIFGLVDVRQPCRPGRGSRRPVVAVRVVGLEHAQAVADGDPRRHDQKSAGEVDCWSVERTAFTVCQAISMAMTVVLPAPVAIFRASRGRAPMLGVDFVERPGCESPEALVGLLLLRGHFGQPDRRSRPPRSDRRRGGMPLPLRDAASAAAGVPSPASPPTGADSATAASGSPLRAAPGSPGPGRSSPGRPPPRWPRVPTGPRRASSPRESATGTAPAAATRSTGASAARPRPVPSGATAPRTAS